MTKPEADAVIVMDMFRTALLRLNGCDTEQAFVDALVLQLEAWKPLPFISRDNIRLESDVLDGIEHYLRTALKNPERYKDDFPSGAASIA